MKRGTQKMIKEMTGISGTMISLILAGKKRPSWKTAKILAGATQTDPVLWIDGSPSDIKAALSSFKEGTA